MKVIDTEYFHSKAKIGLLVEKILNAFETTLKTFCF